MIIRFWTKAIIIVFLICGYFLMIDSSPNDLAFKNSLLKRDIHVKNPGAVNHNKQVIRGEDKKKTIEIKETKIKKKPMNRRKTRKPNPLRRIVPEQKLSDEERKLLRAKLTRSFGVNFESSPAYMDIVKRCSEYPQFPGRIRFFDSSPYLKNPEHACRGQMDILIAVHTRPSNFDRRQLMRETFGSMSFVEDTRILLIFFIGRAGDPQTESRIDEEHKRYGDIVQRDFKEHYRNMTYKHLQIYDWILEHCKDLKHLVKIDDDVFVNIFQVISCIKTFGINNLYGSRTTDTKPFRSRNHKWYVSYDEYKPDVILPYCKGFGYILRASHVKRIYWCSVFTNYLWIDDILLGGILPTKLGIPIEGFVSAHGMTMMWPEHASPSIANHLFFMGSHNKVMQQTTRRLWRAAVRYGYLS